MPLTYQQMQIFQDKSRFWTRALGANLYIFDQHINHLYEISDVLKDLILAPSDSAFQDVFMTLDEEDKTLNEKFLEDILGISDEPVKSDQSCSGVCVLKLNISSQCNLHCSYCFKDEGEVHMLKDPALMYQAIDKMLSDWGRDAQGYTVCFNMASEPLLHTGLLEDLYKYTKKIRSRTGKNIEIFLITNGTIINDKILKLLKKIRKNRIISISIDGPQKYHDALRHYKNGKGSYAQIMETLQVLKKKGMKYAAEAVLSSNNPYPLEILTHLLELGFESINMKPIRRGTPHSFDQESLQVLKKEYDKYFAFLEEQLLAQNFGILNILTKDYALRPFWRILFNHKMAVRCNWGIDAVSMDARGDLYPCDSVMGYPEYKVGSVAGGIDWDKFHLDLDCEKRGQCASCWARHVCSGTCPVNTIIMQKDALEIDPLECELTRFIVEKNLNLISSLLNAGMNMEVIKRILGYNLYQIYLKK